MLLIGFAAGFRRSELVGLNCEDVAFVRRGVLVTLRRSKTDKTGKGREIAIPFIESFNGRLRDEVLNETLFSSLTHARSGLSSWRNDYNDHRPHSGLGWLTPAEFAQTINPRRDAALRSRNGSAQQPAATAQNAATTNRRSELKTG